MKKVEINVYEYKELSDSAKERLRKEHLEGCLYDHSVFEYEYIRDFFLPELLEKNGLKLVKDSVYSDRWDSLIFECEIDPEFYKDKFAMVFGLVNQEWIYLPRVQNLAYEVEISDEEDMWNIQQEAVEEFQDFITNLYNDIRHEASAAYERQIDYIQSDEYLDESLEAQEFLYTENGNFYDLLHNHCVEQA